MTAQASRNRNDAAEVHDWNGQDDWIRPNSMIAVHSRFDEGWAAGGRIAQAGDPHLLPFGRIARWIGRGISTCASGQEYAENGQDKHDADRRSRAISYMSRIYRHLAFLSCDMNQESHSEFCDLSHSRPQVRLRYSANLFRASRRCCVWRHEDAGLPQLLRASRNCDELDRARCCAAPFGGHGKPQDAGFVRP